MFTPIKMVTSKLSMISTVQLNQKEMFSVSTPMNLLLLSMMIPLLLLRIETKIEYLHLEFYTTA